MKIFRCIRNKFEKEKPLNKKVESPNKEKKYGRSLREPAGKKYSIYFWFALSIILILFGNSQSGFSFDIGTLKNVSNSISQALISGLLITFIINIPDMFAYFQKVLYKTITSDEYLSELTIDEVKDLKNKCTTLISNSVPHMAEGLLDLEYKIVEYYKSPYYENYSTFVKCTKEGGYLVKDITTEYTLINPLANNGNIDAVIGLDFFYCKDGDGRAPVLLEFIIQEGNEKKDILNDTQMYETTITTEGAYNTKATIVNKNTQEKYKITLNSVSKNVKLRYKSYAPISDRTYVSILRYPTNNYKMVFYNPKNDLSFSGDFIGPLLTDDHIMINQQEGLISIDCTTWCLPGDGITISIFDKPHG